MKNIKINIKFPSNKEVKNDLDQLIKYMEKNALLDLKIDTKSFKTSLDTMSKALDSLKGKLKNFGVLDNFLNEAEIQKTTNALKGQNKELLEQKKIVEGTVIRKSKTSNLNQDGTKSLLKDVTAVRDEYGRIVEVTNKYDKNTQSLLSSTEKVTDEVEKQKLAQEKANLSLEKFQQVYNNKLNNLSSNNLISPTAIESLQNKLNSFNTDTAEKEITSFKIAVKNLESGESGIVRLQSAISSMERSMSATKNKYGSLVNNNDLKKSTEEVNKLKNSLKDLKSGKYVSNKSISTSINSANDSLRKMTTHAQSASNALKLTQKDAMSMGSAIQTTLGKFGIYASSAMVMTKLFDVIRDGVGYVRTLDEAFFNISSTMNITETQFKGVTVQVQNMAKSMGTSATEVMKIVQTYANASTNMNEVLGKAEGSVILSNITGMDTTNVTKAVNSAINSFKMLDEEGANAINSVERFGDSIVKISQNMQYDFGEGITEIISAIKESGNVAFESGMSFESYASKVGAIVEATGRSGAEISNGMKMIIARTLSIKSLGDELGIAEEEFNKAGKALKEFGINVSNGDGSLKSMDRILQEVASRWSTMTDSERQYLAEAMAGNRQRATMISLMDTMTKSTELYGQAMNSNGTMMEIQDKHMETFNGKLGVLQATFQSLMSNSLNSDFMKGAIDGLSWFTNALDKTISSVGVIPTVITTVVGAMTLFNAKFRENSEIQMRLLIPSVDKLFTKMGNLSKGLYDNTERLKAQISFNQKFATGQIQGAMSTDKLGQSLTVLRGKLLLSTAGMVAMKVATVALQAVMTAGLSFIITSLISGFTKLADSMILTKSEIKELNEESSRMITENNKIIKSVDSLIKKEAELKNKLKDSNITTIEQKQVREELLGVQKQIADLLPESATGFDSEGNAISTNTDKVLENLDAKKKLSEQEAIKMASRGNAYDIQKATEEYVKEKQAYEEMMSAYRDNKQWNGIDVTDKMLAKSEKSLGKYEQTLKDVDLVIKSLQSAGWETQRIADEIFGSYSQDVNIDMFEDLIDVLKETDDAVEDMDNAMDDIDTSGLQDELNGIEGSAEGAENALKDLASEFGNLGNDISILEKALAEFNEHGMIDTSTFESILNTGDAELISLLGDINTFTERGNELLEQKKSLQNDVMNNAITTAQQEIAMKNTEVANWEAGEFAKLNTALQTNSSVINSTAEAVSWNRKNYNTDSQNKYLAEVAKLESVRDFLNSNDQGTAKMVNELASKYGVDTSNFVSAINAKISALNQFIWGYNALTKDISRMVAQLGVGNIANGMNPYLQLDKLEAQMAQMAGNSYGGNYVSGGNIGVGIGNIGSSGSGGSGSSGGGSGSGSAEKEVADLEKLDTRYMKLNATLKQYENRLSVVRDALNDQTKTEAERQKLMKEELVLLQKKREAINALYGETKKESEELKKYLQSYNFQFDESGKILNADALLEQYRQGANNRTGQDKETHVKWVEKLYDTIKQYETLTLDTLANLDKEWADTVNSIKNNQMDMVQSMYDELMDAMREQNIKDKEAQEKVLDDRIEELQKQLKELDDEADDKEKRKAKLEAELSKWQKDDSALSKKKQKELQEEIDRLNKEIQKDKIQEEIDNLEKEKDKIGEIYDEMNSEEALSEQIKKLFAEKNMDEILKLLEGKGKDFSDVGSIFGENLSDGFMEAIKNVFGALDYLGGLGVTIDTSGVKSSRGKGALESMQSFDTGGYTGDWSGNEGKLAMLHKKELVLNPVETKLFDRFIGILPTVMSNIGRFRNPLEEVANNVEINNTYNITNHTPMDVEKTGKTLEQIVKSDLRRSGVIK